MFGEDKRNLLIAIGVIFVILVGWQFLMPALFPSDERPRRVVEQREPGTAPPSLDQAAPEMTTGADAPDQAQLRQAGIDSPRITIESRRLSGSIARLGGRIDSVTLLDYHETADEESPNIVLFQPRDAARPFFADFGWISAAGGIALPQPDTLWDADRATLSPGRPVTLHWDNGAGLSFTRKIAVDDDFVFTVTQSVRNTTAAPIALAPYSRIARFSDATESILPFKPLFIFQDGALGIFGEDYQEADYDDMRDAYDAQVKNPRAGADYRYESTGGWMGLTDKYWLVALIPDQATLTPRQLRVRAGRRRAGRLLPDHIRGRAAHSKSEADCLAHLAPLHRRQGDQPPRPLRGRAGGGPPGPRRRLRAGVVPVEADVLRHRLLQQGHRQFRRRHPAADDLRAGAAVPVGQQGLRVHEPDAQAPAGDDPPARALQGRQAADEYGADEALPGAESQPGRGLPAAGGADSGVLRPLLHAVRHHRDAPCALLRLDRRSLGAGSDDLHHCIRVPRLAGRRSSCWSASGRSSSARPCGSR